MPDKEPADAGESGSRVFTDAAGRSWRASFSQADNTAALEFTCLGESREPSRVMEVSNSFTFTGISDDTLRSWLAAAPRLGRLNE